MSKRRNTRSLLIHNPTLSLPHPIDRPLERALTGHTAGAFDHGAHAFPDLHQRLRRHLSGGVNDRYPPPLISGRKNRLNLTRSGDSGHVGDKSVAAAAVFEAHAWEEEAPQTQLNGGSDPIVVTATHIIYHGGGGGERRAGGPAFAPGVRVCGGKSAGGGDVRLQLRVYNGTNSRLHGFSVRLSFGQGGEAVGMGDGGRVETAVDEVLVALADLVIFLHALFHAGTYLGLESKGNKIAGPD